MCRHTRKYFFVLFVTKNKLFVLIVIGKTRYLIDYLRNLHLDYDCKRNLEMQETGNTADNLCIFFIVFRTSPSSSQKAFEWIR